MHIRQVPHLLAAAALTFAMASPALAIHSPEHYELFGNAELVSPGNASATAVRLVSDSATTTPYGGIDFPIEDGTTFAELTTLSSDFMLEADDACIGGSPRYQINIDTDGDGDSDGNIFVYFGTESGGAPCVPGTWQNTGDVLEAGRILDTAQLPGGTYADPYVDALARYGNYEVVGIQVVNDSSWAMTDGELTVDIDNTLVNATLYTYEEPVVVPVSPTTKDQCMKGGYANYVDNDGNAFKNQGDCVSFVATKGKNPASPRS